MMGEKFKEATRAASRLREKRHRREVRLWQILAIVCTLGSSSVGAYIKMSSTTSTDWRHDTPPANQKIMMVVWAYKGADGTWKSYAEGHPVEPVTSLFGEQLWKP